MAHRREVVFKTALLLASGAEVLVLLLPHRLLRPVASTSEHLVRNQNGAWFGRRDLLDLPKDSQIFIEPEN